MSVITQFTGLIFTLSDGERDVIAAVFRSVFSAMARVGPESRPEMQTLVAAFIANPADKAIVARLGAILQHGRVPDH